MELAFISMKKMLLYYICIHSILLLGIILCFIVSYSKKTKKDLSFLGFAASILFIFILFADFVPFLKDYIGTNIIVAEGMYINKDSHIGNTHSDNIGSSDIIFISDGAEIELVTAVYSKDIFINGEYPVVAYYLPESKILLNIEVLKTE